MTTLAVLVACHNRRVTTLNCLTALFRCRLPATVRLDVILLDDGSTDGTADVIAADFPSVRILKGDGTLFWNRSMHQAFAVALAQGYDGYLWLNDDTTLFEDGLERILAADASVRAVTGRPGILVGGTRDPVTKQLNYGGGTFGRPRDWLNTTLVRALEEPVSCETMTGNCVLIPRAVAERVGNLDWEFEHGLGDYDYGLRAQKLGVSLWALGVIGECKSHAFIDQSKRNLSARLSWMMARNQLPPRSWARFARRHAGFAWPLYFVWPYVKIAIGPLLIQAGVRPPYAERPGHRP